MIESYEAQMTELYCVELPTLIFKILCLENTISEKMPYVEERGQNMEKMVREITKKATSLFSEATEEAF